MVEQQVRCETCVKWAHRLVCGASNANPNPSIASTEDTIQQLMLWVGPGLKAEDTLKYIYKSLIIIHNQPTYHEKLREMFLTL